jgi:Family of unknown function (DUF6455)
LIQIKANKASENQLILSVAMTCLEDDKMLDALAVWISHQPDHAAFGLSENDELEQLAKDLGVSASELRDLVSSVPDPLQLPDMLKALGIDEDSLRRARPTLLRALQRRCAHCAVVARCRHSLDQHVAAEDYEQFCPNAAVLTAYRPIHERSSF